MGEIIHIKEPFYVAGKIYDWLDEYRPIGLGINIIHLTGNDDLLVKVGDNEKLYSIKKALAREIHEKYNSVFNTKTEPSVKLAVLPWNAFKRVTYE
jgi:hypothetical protein